MNEERIIEIIERVSRHWQPFGDPYNGDDIYIIQTREPYFWRLNPEWLKEVAKEIMKELQEVKNEECSF